MTLCWLVFFLTYPSFPRSAPLHLLFSFLLSPPLSPSPPPRYASTADSLSRADGAVFCTVKDALPRVKEALNESEAHPTQHSGMSFIVGVRDLASRNGTFINGKSTVPPVPPVPPVPRPVEKGGNGTGDVTGETGEGGGRGGGGRGTAGVKGGTGGVKSTPVVPLRLVDTLAMGFVVARDGRCTFTDVVYRLSGFMTTTDQPHTAPTRG